MKKTFFILIFASTLATAAPVAPHFPDNAFAAQLHYQNTPSPRITQPVNQIVAYFDKEGKLVDKAVARGYYRLHLGNAANGWAVAQDFYTDTQTKQTNTFSIPQVDLKNFYPSQVLEKTHFWYHPNGRFLGVGQQNNRHSKHFAYYKANQLDILATKIKNQSWIYNADKQLQFYITQSKNQVVRRFYLDGEMTVQTTWKINPRNPHDLTMHVVAFHSNGKKMYEFDSKNIDDKKMWNNDGIPFEKLSDNEKTRLGISISLLITFEQQLFKEINPYQSVEYPEN